MPADPPVGTPPPGEPCAPCAEQPEDCVASVRSLQQQVCDLKTNYQAVLSQYSEIRRAFVSQGQTLNDLINQYNQIQQQIRDQDGSSCSRFGLTTKPGALIACADGVMNKFAAPETGGMGLISKDGFWQLFTPGQTYTPAPAQLITNAGASNVPVTFPGYPAGGTAATVTAFFLSSIFVVNGVGSGQLLLNGGQTLNFKRAFGSNSDGNYLYAMAQVNPTETFNIISVGGATLNVDVELLGFLSKVS